MKSILNALFRRFKKNFPYISLISSVFVTSLHQIQQTEPMKFVYFTKSLFSQGRHSAYSMNTSSKSFFTKNNFFSVSY